MNVILVTFADIFFMFFHEKVRKIDIFQNCQKCLFLGPFWGFQRRPVFGVYLDVGALRQYLSRLHYIYVRSTNLVH